MWWLAVLLTFSSLAELLLANCPCSVRVELAEEMPRGTPVSNLRHEMVRLGQFTERELRSKDFRVLGGHRDYLKIDKDSGIIRTKMRIDRESLCDEINTCCETSTECRLSLQIALSPKDLSADPTPEIAMITVAILDINDHTPKWSSKLIQLDIPEHTTVGSRFKLPTAIDPDDSPNTTKRYELKGASGQFALDVQRRMEGDSVKHNVFLKVISDLDRETRAGYRVVLLGVDGGIPAKTGSVTLNITITDINDHQPVFKVPDGTVSVVENSMGGAVIAKAAATDQDPSDKFRLEYKMGGSAIPEVQRMFRVDAQSGDIVLMKELDYEKRTSYQIPISVTDGKHVKETTYTVQVQNVNDNKPSITVNSLSSQQTNEFTIGENLEPNQFIASVTVADEDDRDGNQQVKCRIRDSNFNILPLSERTKNIFKIVSMSVFDREQKADYRTQIECQDGGEPSLKSSKSIRIRITDENDSKPNFGPLPRIAYLEEGGSNNQLVTRMQALDMDEGINKRIAYSLDPMSQDYFKINRSTGEIFALRPFDREKVERMNITVTATDRAGAVPKPGTSEAEQPVKANSVSGLVVVYIKDVNDCDPVFDVPDGDDYKFKVVENSVRGTAVGRVHAEDADVTNKNRKVSYRMLVDRTRSNEAYKVFKVHPDGWIRVNTDNLDREKVAVYSFEVLAVDQGSPQRSSSVHVTVNVEDENDNTPQWIFPTNSNKRVNVSFHSTVGYNIAKLQATDKDDDKNSEIVFSLTTKGRENDLFKVTEQGDVILRRKIVDKDTTQMYKLIVKASDKGERPKWAMTVMDIYIVRNSRNMSNDTKQVENNLIIIISMIAVTLIISLFLIAAIIFLRCSLCAKFLGMDYGNQRNGHVYRPGGTYEQGQTSNALLNRQQEQGQTLQYKMRINTNGQTMDRKNTIVTTEGKVLLEDCDSVDSGRGCSSDTGTKFDGLHGFHTYRHSPLPGPMGIDSKKNINSMYHTSPRLATLRSHSNEQILGSRGLPDRAINMSTGQLHHPADDHMVEELEEEEEEEGPGGYQNVGRPYQVLKDREIFHQKSASTGAVRPVQVIDQSPNNAGLGHQYMTLKRDDSGQLLTLDRVGSPTKNMNTHVRQPTSFV